MRINGVMRKLISRESWAYIEDSHSLGGVLIANEVIDDAQILCIVSKIDLTMAYDNVSWEFHDYLLGMRGFKMKW